MQKHKTSVSLFLMLIGGSLTVGRVHGESSQIMISPEVRFVAAGIADARQHLKCAQAVITCYEYTPVAYLNHLFAVLQQSGRVPSNFPERNRALERTYTISWYYQQPKLAMLVRPDPNSHEIWNYQRIVSDAEHAKVLYEYDDAVNNPGSKSTYHIGVIAPTASVIKSGLWQQWAHLDPRYYVYYYGETPLDQLFLESKPAAAFKGEEIIDGSRCMKIEIRQSEHALSTFWIDTDHNFLLRREEEHRRVNNKTVLSREVQTQHLLTSNGVSWPAVIERKDFFRAIESTRPSQGSKTNTDAPSSSILLKRMTISDFKTDCNMPVEVFTLQWPLGTNITDAINQTHSVVLAIEKRDLATFNKQRKEQGKPEYTSAAIEEKELAALNQYRKTQGQAAWQDAVAVAVDEEDLTRRSRNQRGSISLVEIER